MSTGNQFGDESGAPTTAPDTEDEFSTVPDDVEFTAEDEREYITNAANGIEKQLLEFGDSWEGFTDEVKVGTILCMS